MKILDEPLSNFDIERIVNNLGMANLFGGCFLKNELPKNVSAKYYIVNLDDSHTNKGGTHWTLLVIRDSRRAIYFDSFGMPPPNEVVKFLGDRQIIYSSNEMQNVNSVLCGYFCIYFMNELFCHKSLYDILYDVSGNSDSFLKRYFKDM